MSILDQIIATKRQEVAACKARTSTAQLEKQGYFARACHSLAMSLIQPASTGVIAEFKRKSPSKGILNLEEKIEKELFKQLGIKCPAYIRSKEQLEGIIKKDPFKGAVHSKSSYLIVSFLKKAPYEIFTSVDTAASTTPKFMTDLDKKYSKTVTTRTWKTVERILAKM